MTLAENALCPADILLGRDDLRKGTVSLEYTWSVVVDVEEEDDNVDDEDDDSVATVAGGDIIVIIIE